MKEMLISLLDTLGLAWWVEVSTETPRCIYYFGPFFSADSARMAQPGYLEDLEQEGAKGIKVAIKRCKPSILTIADDLEEKPIPGKMQVLSGQLQ